MKLDVRSLSADVGAVLLFAFLARIAHRSESMPLTVFTWLDTAWPFLLGTAVGSVLVATFGWQAWRVFPSGVVIWLITAVSGLTIWSIRNGHVAHWSFIIVATTMSGMLLISWRAAMRLRKSHGVVP